MYIASFNLDIHFSVSSIKYNYIFRNPINEIAKNLKKLFSHCKSLTAELPRSNQSAVVKATISALTILYFNEKMLIKSAAYT